MGYPATQKCKYCDDQATSRTIWAEGMAYVPTCDDHISKAEDSVGKDEVIRVDKIANHPGVGWVEISPSGDYYTDMGEIQCFLEDEGDEVHWLVQYDDGEVIDQGVRETMSDAVFEVDEFLKFIGKTAAAPGGVLPYNPSDRGYLWVEHSNGVYHGVTNDNVNEMHLYLDNLPWVNWQVYDDQGLVEDGNFSNVPTVEQAVSRANRLLSEFDTNPEIPPKSYGYDPNYSETPNPWA